MVASASSQGSPLAFPGAIIAGKYRLEQAVGSGGMGSVWAATHVALGQLLAIKLISADLVKSPEALRRFDVEAKAAVQIKSRHVPQVFDNGVLEDGTPYIVMELLQGESLVKRIERLGAVPLPEAVTILAQCCRALTRAHALGIAHRDIKPDNIYLAQLQDEDGYIVKILDFGVAKMTMASEGGQSGTRTGTLIGTPAYMSPEQARGLSTLDFRTDLYSLGVVAYAMLTGKQAFGAESLGDLLLQICVEPLPSLLAAAPALPPAIDVWFQRACARAPEARFQSAQALAEGLVVASGLSQLQGRMSALVASNTPNGRESGPSLHLPPPSEVIGKSTTGVSALAGDLAEGGPKRSPGLLVALTALLVILGLVVGIAILKSTSSTNQPPPSAVFLVQSASLAPSALPPAIDRIVVETQAVDASSQQAVVPPAPSPGPIKNENEHRRSRDHSRERGVTPTPPPPQVATPPDNNNVGY